MDEGGTGRAKKHGKLFYLGIVVFLIIGLISLSMLVNTFSEAGKKTISVPMAFPVVAIIVFYEGVVRGRDLSEVGVKRENFWRNVGIGVLLAFFGFFGMFAAVNLVIPGLMEEISGRAETISSLLRSGFPFPLNYILQTIYAFTLLAPAEDLLFRGFIQGKLQKWMNDYLAIIIQSILFRLAHGIPVYVMGLPIVHSVGYGLIGFFGGILLGITFYKTDNSIVAPWIAHAISDSPLALLIFGA